jgi:hypothetical protein
MNISVNSGELLLINGIHSGSIGLGTGYEYTFQVPSGTTGTHLITYVISYSFSSGWGEDEIARSGSRTLTTAVTITDVPTTAAAQPILENVQASAANIPSGEAFEISTDIFNGTERITNAALTVYHGSTQLARRFIGVINAGAVSNETLTIPGISETGDRQLTVTLSYRGAGGASLSTSRSITVRSGNPVVAQPTLENLMIVDNEVFAGRAFDINADIFPGSDRITGAVLTVNIGSAQLTRRFIGTIEAGVMSDNTLRIPGIDTVGNQTLTVMLTYRDRSGADMATSKSITARVLEPNGEQAGMLRIQNISAPIRTEVDTHANVSFTLTNPTPIAITGAEAFLYDDSGTLLTSVYIVASNANSTDTISLSFPVTGRTGLRSYSLVINYKNAENASKTISGDFSITVLHAGEASADERPSSLRIQRINAPAQMFTGVRTNIPFTLVNAGRGMAYNVEVYILNEFGEEIAREYVGAIPAMGSIDGNIPLRFNQPDTYNLTFIAVSENSDETLSQISRNFEQRAVDYRVTITDLGGHDWIWNNMTTIEFGVINGGSEIMLNTTAQLINIENGTVFAETYIGTINPGEKKERVRFRDVYIWDDGMGFMEMAISLTYENAEMQEFPVSHPFFANFYSDGGWDDPWVGPPGDWDEPWEFEEEDGGSVWLVVLIVSISVLVIGGTVTIIVVSKKRKVRDEDDDIDYFLSQMKMDSVPGVTAPAGDSQNEELTL